MDINICLIINHHKNTSHQLRRETILSITEILDEDGIKYQYIIESLQ